MAVGVIVLGGCSPERPKAPGIYCGEKKAYLKDLAPSDVFAIVNGHKIYKRDYESYLALGEKIYRFKRGLPMAGENKDVTRYLNMTARALPAELISRQLMIGAAEKAGIKVSAETRENAEKEIVKAMGNRVKSIGAIAKKLGGSEGVFFIKMVEENAIMDEFRKKCATNDITFVSQAEITNVLAHIVKWNQNADRQNERSKKKALKFREAALKPGVDFEKLTRQHAKVSPEFGKFWDSFQMGELDDGEPLKVWLAGAKEGDLSQPIDLDDGIAIVKLLKKTETQIPGETMVVVDYDLARCTFYAYQHVKEQTAEEIREELLRNKAKDAQKELGTKLWNEAVFEYPFGDQFFPPEKGKKRMSDAQNEKGDQK